jgi:hypothetical protein
MYKTICNYAYICMYVCIYVCKLICMHIYYNGSTFVPSYFLIKLDNAYDFYFLCASTFDLNGWTFNFP